MKWNGMNHPNDDRCEQHVVAVCWHDSFYIQIAPTTQQAVSYVGVCTMIYETINTTCRIFPSM